MALILIVVTRKRVPVPRYQPRSRALLRLDARDQLTVDGSQQARGQVAVPLLRPDLGAWVRLDQPEAEMRPQARVVANPGLGGVQLDPAKMLGADEAVLHRADGGQGAVRVESLAQALGVTKGGFYWHLADRGALLDEMLDH